MIRFKTGYFILILIISETIFGYTYTSEDGAEVEYKVQFKRNCRGEMDLIVTLYGIPISECALACGLRTNCKVVSYIKRYNKCNLYFTDGDEHDRSTGSCVEIPRADIQLKKVLFSFTKIARADSIYPGGKSRTNFFNYFLFDKRYEIKLTC